MGSTQLFFGRNVSCRFPKVGFREPIFYEKIGVFGIKFWEICTLRAEILVKNKPENSFFSLKVDSVGPHAQCIDGKIGRLGSAD